MYVYVSSEMMRKQRCDMCTGNRTTRHAEPGSSYFPSYFSNRKMDVFFRGKENVCNCFKQIQIMCFIHCRQLIVEYKYILKHTQNGTKERKKKNTHAHKIIVIYTVS